MHSQPDPAKHSPSFAAKVHPGSPSPMHPMIARGLIRDEHGRILIVLPVSAKLWHLPGGTIEDNESPTEACEREIREELGLDLVAGAMIAVAWTAPRSAARRARATFIFDMGEIRESVLRQCVRLQRSEVTEWQLVSHDKALSLLHPDVAVRLSAHRGREATAVYIEHRPATAFTAPGQAP